MMMVLVKLLTAVFILHCLVEVSGVNVSASESGIGIGSGDNSSSLISSADNSVLAVISSLASIETASMISDLNLLESSTATYFIISSTSSELVMTITSSIEESASLLLTSSSSASPSTMTASITTMPQTNTSITMPTSVENIATTPFDSSLPTATFSPTPSSTYSSALISSSIDYSSDGESGFVSGSGDNSSILTTSITSITTTPPEPSTSTIISNISTSMSSIEVTTSSIVSLTVDVTTNASISTSVVNITIASSTPVPSSSFTASSIVSSPISARTPSITTLPTTTFSPTSFPSFTSSLSSVTPSLLTTTPQLSTTLTSTTSITPSITPFITSTPSITPSITPLITSTPSTSITPSITPLITSTTSTSSVVPSTAPPGPFDLSFIAIIIAVIVTILLIVIVILFISVIFFRKRNRVKDDELGQLIDGPGNVIILSNISSNGYDPRSLFSHIPVLPSVELNRLENYVKNLEDDETASDEFMELQEHGHDLPQTKANLNVNSAKNRYVNILPYDATRVVLSTVNKKEGSDYINANYIQGYNHRYEYIATQGPLPYTINDFWRMIWEKECEVIVMVTNPVEGGNTKCEVYWPEEQHTSQYGGISVTHLEEEIQPSCTKRTFLLSLPEKSDNSKRDLTSRNCIQFHFTSWPDMGVPNDAGTMLRFVRNVRATARNSDKPIVVHCSAGVGRTGTYIAIDILMQRMTEYHNVNVQELILQMRAQRISMVQTMPQYVFIYMCLLYEYLYGETEVKREELSDHLEKLLEVFPETEDSRMDKEFEGAQRIIEPDSSILEYATHADNVSKNRPGAGIPLDLNRVCLSDPHETGNDYINASFIGCISRRAEYILTQHPLKNTTEDFWRMILDRHVNTVVVIGNVKDEDEYWPGEKQFEWEDLTVKLVEVDEMDDIKICGVEVEHEISEEYQMVTIFQLTDWPSESETVPTSPKSLLNLVNIIAEHKKGLVLIHTAAGVSNEASGVFAVINTLVHYLREPERKVNIMEIVRRTLQQRPGCISTKEQYEFIYECLIHSIDNS